MNLIKQLVFVPRISAISTALVRLLALSLFGFSSFSYGIEKPKYEVVFSSDEVEYRLYQPYIVATTTVEESSSYSKAANEGFMRLFRYISGDNRSSKSLSMTAPVQQKTGQKISMTSPVQQSEGGSGWEISFMLPSDFTLETAPTPENSAIQVRPVPARLMAVMRYSGRWSEKNFNKYEGKLRQLLAEAGVTITGLAESAVYNPPFVPPFMRRNEVMLEVASIPDQS